MEYLALALLFVAWPFLDGAADLLKIKPEQFRWQSWDWNEPHDWIDPHELDLFFALLIQTPKKWLHALGLAALVAAGYIGAQTGQFAGKDVIDYVALVVIPWQSRNLFMHVLLVKKKHVSFPFFRWIIPLGKWIRNLGVQE